MTVTSALIPAAGKGRRFGSDKNKVLAEVAGKPIIAHTLAAFQSCRAIDEIVLVVGEADVPLFQKLINDYGPFDKVTHVVAGGAERGDSVRAGLAHVRGDIVAIHDGARPLVTDEIITSSIETAREFGAAVAAVPVVDTIKESDDAGFVQSTLDRSRLYQIQTPQTFRTEEIRKAYKWAEEHAISATDDAAIYEKAIGKVKLVMGSYDNIKVTGQQDVRIVECGMRNAESWDMGIRQVTSNQLPVISKTSPPGPLSDAERGNYSTIVCGSPPRVGEGLGERSIIPSETPAVTPTPNSQPPTPARTGLGYDIHRFAPGRRLVLGGVEFESDEGLLGHSDADVILHAISDALLGAVALGDIGKLFPNTDPDYKDISSLVLLSKVAELLSSQGWVVVNIDAMMIGEKPKIASKTDEMKTKIAEAIGTNLASISIKATTAEGLGYIGAGEGICCYAVATVARK